MCIFMYGCKHTFIVNYVCVYSYIYVLTCFSICVYEYFVTAVFIIPSPWRSLELRGQISLGYRHRVVGLRERHAKIE